MSSIIRDRNSDIDITHTKSNNKHVEWVDFAKVLTMILVIVGHSGYYSISSKYGGINHSSSFPLDGSLISAIIQISINFIYSFHMGTFMLLSGIGFSFGYKKFKNSLGLIHNKFKRLIIPFFFVSILYAVPCKYFSGYWNESSNLLYDIIMGQILLLGNSHMWFVISLFIITIVFFLLLKIHPKINRVVYWSILTLISLVGYYFENSFSEIGHLFGFIGAMKFLIFFAIGFYSYRWIDNHPKRGMTIIISWVLMIICWWYFPKKFPLNYLISFSIAIWGAFTIIFTAKYLISHINFNNYRIYRILKRYNYQLYLYSDPLNYVLIAMVICLNERMLWAVPNYSYMFIVRMSLTLSGALIIGICMDKFHQPNIRWIAQKLSLIRS